MLQQFFIVPPLCNVPQILIIKTSKTQNQQQDHYIVSTVDKIMGKFKIAAVERVAQQYYEIDKIVDKKVDQCGQVLYRVRWLGYSEAEDTWEPIEHLMNVRKAVDKFQKQTSGKTKGVQKAQQPIRSQNKMILVKNPLHKEPLTKPSNASQLKTIPSKQKLKLQLKQKPKIIISLSHTQTQTQTKIHTQIKIRSQTQTTIQSPTLPQSQENKYYLVERIVGKKFCKKQNRMYYQIKWVGYTSKENTWQPVQNLQNAKQALKIYQGTQTKTKQIRKPRKITNKTKQMDKTQAKQSSTKHRNGQQITQYNKTLIMESALHDSNQALIDRVQHDHLHSETDNYQIGGMCSLSEYMEDQMEDNLNENDRGQQQQQQQNNSRIHKSYEYQYQYENQEQQQQQQQQHQQQQEEASNNKFMPIDDLFSLNFM